MGNFVEFIKSDDYFQTFEKKKELEENSFCPSVLVLKTGRIIIFYLLPDIDNSPYNKLKYVYSDDDGDTFSDPIEITDFVCSGKISSAELTTGRIVVSYFKHIDDEDKKYLAYSDTYGEEWVEQEIVYD